MTVGRSTAIVGALIIQTDDAKALMDFTGLLKKYPIERKISVLEKAHQLRQEVHLKLPCHDHLCTIKLNSTFLESVDKWFAWKGYLSLFMISIMTIAVLAFGFMANAVYYSHKFSPDYRLSTNIFGVMIVAVLWVAIWMLRRDWFAYTHYPIRFNRKSRMVYVFRPDGTCLTVPWDDVFLTLGRLPQMNDWEVRGHVLDKDQTTVKETFALSYWGQLASKDLNPDHVGPSTDDFLRSHWEFIRRYMEDGPEAVIHQVQFCMPLDGRRETVRTSIARTFANISSAPGILYLLLFPLCAVVSISRLGAMRTSKIPQWPAEIEAACKVKDGDPYAIAGDASGRRVAVFPEAAKAAGIYFDPARCPTASKGGMQHNF